ncbi:MAG: GGDEF domain-containing protein [Pseudomonadota bacterium]
MRDAILGLLNPLIALIFATTFLVIWSRDRSRKEMLAFAGGYVGLGLGFLWSQFVPFDGARWLLNLTNIPYFFSSWMIIWGVSRRVRTTVPAPLVLMVGATLLTLLVSKQWLGASINAELYISNTAYAILFLIGAQATAASRKESAANAAIFWLIAATSFQFFVRPNITMMIEGELEFATYRESAYYSILNAVAAINSLCLAMAIIYASVSDTMQRERERVSRDALSGVWSRHAFETKVRTALEKALEERVPVSLVIGDIDHFKQVNDIWGHQIGDRAIRSFAQLLDETVRSTDLVGRVGGEEFCILVWNAEEDVAGILAERLRANTSEIDLGSDALNVHLTASFGVAQYRFGEGYDSLFRRADNALYAAKRCGRDQVLVESKEHKAKDELAASA